MLHTFIRFAYFSLLQWNHYYSELGRVSNPSIRNVSIFIAAVRYTTHPCSFLFFVSSCALSSSFPSLPQCMTPTIAKVPLVTARCRCILSPKSPDMPSLGDPPSRRPPLSNTCSCWICNPANRISRTRPALRGQGRADWPPWRYGRNSPASGS